MASLDILCSNFLNLKNNITKIEHKKIFCGPSKILKNISWPINICLKYFMTPQKPSGLPSYIPNVWSPRPQRVSICSQFLHINEQHNNISIILITYQYQLKELLLVCLKIAFHVDPVLKKKRAGSSPYTSRHNPKVVKQSRHLKRAGAYGCNFFAVFSS